MIQFSAPLHRDLQPELQLIDVWTAMAIPSFRVVGLPGQEIIESCERVRAAIEASGMEFPRKRVLVNLSPAGIRKQGTGTDLAIALAIIHSSFRSSAARVQPAETSRRIVASGELALDGSVRSAGRVLRTCWAAIHAEASDLILAAEDDDTVRRALALIAQTREWRPGIRVHLVSSLREVLPIFENAVPIALAPPHRIEEHEPTNPDLLSLEETLERTIAIASAGSHHLLLVGPKGTGKTAALQWLRTLQAQLSPRELLDRLLLEELLDPGAPNFLQRAPVRTVPPQIRPESLVGGIHRGQLRPGEFCQAHGGTLIADEFLEWPRDSRECLRDPMESGQVQLTRSQRSIEIPARFQLAASANLCRCGGWPRAWSEARNLLSSEAPVYCHCSDHSRSEYLARLSGPILDRIDLIRLVFQKPSSPSSNSTPVDLLRERIARCREHLVRLWGSSPGRITGAQLEELLKSEPAIQRGWNEIRRPAPPSLRRRHKEIRVALTLASYDQTIGAAQYPIPNRSHFEEASRSSADSWMHSLFRTELKPRRAFDSSIDPGPEAV